MDYFDNFLDTIAQTPNEEYRGLLQAFINDQWDNTTTLATVQEETSLGSFEFQDVDVLKNTIVEFTVNMPKNEKDYRQLIFQDCTHNTPRGLYYQFDDNYWITYEQTSNITPTGDVKVRRCNNVAKWIDKTNGKILSYPCVLDYTVSSAYMQSTKDINTANSNTLLILQGNSETLKIKKNQRFIFNGCPYRVYAYNNFMQDGIVDDKTPLLFLEVYLDMEQSDDNMTLGIANYYEYTYTLNIVEDDFSQLNGFSGTLSAEVKYNAVLGDYGVTWSSNEFVTVNQNGEFTLNGADGDVAIIKAQLGTNEDIYDEIQITIVGSIATNLELIINPVVTELKQGRTISFNTSVFNNGEIQANLVDMTDVGLVGSYSITRVGNDFTLKNIKTTTIPLVLTFTSGSLSKTISIKLSPIF